MAKITTCAFPETGLPDLSFFNLNFDPSPFMKDLPYLTHLPVCVCVYGFAAEKKREERRPRPLPNERQMVDSVYTVHTNLLVKVEREAGSTLRAP